MIDLTKGLDLIDNKPNYSKTLEENEEIQKQREKELEDKQNKDI